MPSVRDHLDWHLKRPLHGLIARRVFWTPPLPARDDGVVLFSMVGSNVVAPYLVAIKSLGRMLGRGRAVVLDDGTLTAADRERLRAHLPGVEIRAAAAVDTGACPRGGCWERLLAILDLRAEAYVVQLDTDTLTLRAVPEVAAAIAANRSFSLRGEPGSRLMTVGAFAAGLAPMDPPLHIQHAAERAMARLDLDLPEPRYFRGCAGFAGFARGAGGRALVEAFSAAQARAVGAERWASWGSEQVASNFVIANDADPLLLPQGRYLNHWGGLLPADARFAHFLGTCRFRGSTYMAETGRAIRTLARAG
ncbi:hypothetical protein [uncultured Sphingomonas sp.]|uniref:hypothetical protein n=1 Tax=uncultured Sphingomonas sp. TaxID=158754 RepID=UPI0035C9981E